MEASRIGYLKGYQISLSRQTTEIVFLFTVTGLWPHDANISKSERFGPVLFGVSSGEVNVHRQVKLGCLFVWNGVQGGIEKEL